VGRGEAKRRPPTGDRGEKAAATGSSRIWESGLSCVCRGLAFFAFVTVAFSSVLDDSYINLALWTCGIY
jgi:hypothetical protein